MKQGIRVVAVVRRQDEVLLLKRNQGRAESSPVWELPMGKIRFGEQPEESVARLLFDYTGATVDTVKLKDVTTFTSSSGADQYYNTYVIFEVRLKDGERLQAYGKYTAYKFIRVDDPQVAATMDIEEESQNLIDIEINRIARPIFDGVAHNMLGSNLTSATVYVDGGSRGNPGPSGVGYYIENGDGVPIKSGGNFIGFATSRVAEYYALREGMEQAIKLGIRSARFVSDSLMLINQMNGVYKVKNKDLEPIYNSIRELLKNFDSVSFLHVKREKNVEADRQVNNAINKHFDNSEETGTVVTSHDEA